MKNNQLLNQVWILACFSVFFKATEATLNEVGPTDFCIDKNETIPWAYTHESDMFSVTWLKGSTTLMIDTGSGTPIIISGSGVELDSSVSNAGLKVLTVDTNSDGNYTCTVLYNPGTEAPASDVVLVTLINDVPGEPTFTKTGKTISCGTNSTSSNVRVRIKVNGVILDMNSAEVEITHRAHCCFVGREAKCADGNKNKTDPYCVEVQEPGTTTTATATTTITSSSTSMMTSSLGTSTASISTSTISTMAQSTVTSTKSTIKPSRGTITSISPVTTAVSHVPDRDSDKAIVTMIIVVSVIGGVLIVAIFSIMFVIMRWKSCFTRRGHHKQYAQRSDHRKQLRQAEYNASGSFFTTHRDHAMSGYYFYNGKYKNPLFYHPFENSSDVNNYYPNQKNTHDPKYMSSHETYQYDRDFNWDLKDSY